MSCWIVVVFSVSLFYFLPLKTFIQFIHTFFCIFSRIVLDNIKDVTRRSDFFQQHQLISNYCWSTCIAQPIFLSVDVKINGEISNLFNLLTSNMNMNLRAMKQFGLCTVVFCFNIVQSVKSCTLVTCVTDHTLNPTQLSEWL